MQHIFSLLWVIFASLSDAFDTLVYKRVAEIAIRQKINKIFLVFIDYTTITVVFSVLGFFAFGRVIWWEIGDIFSSLTYLSLLLGVAIARICTVVFFATAYGNEKISILAPYAQVSSILGIIFGFILFPGTTSWITLIFALIASAILLGSNINRGSLQFNKYCLVLVISEVAQALGIIFSAKLAFGFSPIAITVWHCAVWAWVLLGTYFVAKNPRGIHLPKWGKKMGFLGRITLSNTFWLSNVLISLYLFRNFGVTLTILLSMSTILVSFVSSYFVYGDVPTRKNIIVAILISLCIALGTYFSPALVQ